MSNMCIHAIDACFLKSHRQSYRAYELYRRNPLFRGSVHVRKRLPGNLSVAKMLLNGTLDWGDLDVVDK